jgi:hypothetical protein
LAYIDYGLSFLNERIGRNRAILSPSIRILEDEILVLRNTMEQTYLREETLNSENVIEISRKLDVKINEYMQVKHKCFS